MLLLFTKTKLINKHVYSTIDVIGGTLFCTTLSMYIVLQFPNLVNSYNLPDLRLAIVRNCPYTLDGGLPRIRLHIALLAS